MNLPRNAVAMGLAAYLRADRGLLCVLCRLAAARPQRRRVEPCELVASAPLGQRPLANVAVAREDLESPVAGDRVHAVEQRLEQLGDVAGKPLLHAISIVYCADCKCAPPARHDSDISVDLHGLPWTVRVGV